MTIASLYGLVDQREYFKKTIASQNMEGYYLLHNGEFAYNKSYSKGFDFGAIKRLDRYDCGALSTLYICFAVNNKVDSDFMTHYFSSDLENNNIHHLSMTRFITENAITNSATKRIPYNSILIVSRVGVGKVAIAPCELCTSQDFTNLVNPICNPIFLGYLLSLTMQIKANGVQGTSIKGVTAKEIKQYYLSIPQIEEQQKIAGFLSAYDEAISYSKQELDKWKELKKGLLQQMFV